MAKVRKRPSKITMPRVFANSFLIIQCFDFFVLYQVQNNDRFSVEPSKSCLVLIKSVEVVCEGRELVQGRVA